MPARKIALDELRRLHAEGWHRDELAAHFDVDPSVVTKTRRELGLPLDAPRRSPLAGRRRTVDREAFAALDAQGWTSQELAAHFGVSQATVTRVRRELGRSRAHFLTPERLAWISARLEDGWSFAEISRTEGVHQETLRRHFPGQAWTVPQRSAHTASLRYFREVIGRATWALSSTDLRKSSRVA